MFRTQTEFDCDWIIEILLSTAACSLRLSLSQNHSPNLYQHLLLCQIFFYFHPFLPHNNLKKTARTTAVAFMWIYFFIYLTVHMDEWMKSELKLRVVQRIVIMSGQYETSNSKNNELTLRSATLHVDAANLVHLLVIVVWCFQQLKKPFKCHFPCVIREYIIDHLFHSLSCILTM